MHFKIRTKLIITFLGILIPFLLVLGILSIYNLNIIYKSAHKVDGISQEMQATHGLQLALHRSLMPGNDYIITGNKKYIDDFNIISRDVDRFINETETIVAHSNGTSAGKEEREILEYTKTAWQNIKEISLKILAIQNPVGSKYASRLMEDMDYNWSLPAVARLKRWQEIDREEYSRSHKNFETAWRQVLIIMISGSGILIAFGVSFALYYSKLFVKPIKAVHERAEAIARGDFKTKGVVKTGDEIEQLDIAMNDMAAQLDSLYNNMQAMIEEKTRRLQDSENRAQTITDTAGDAIICLEAPDTVNLWNKKAEEMFGYTEDEVMGKKLHELIVPERDRNNSFMGLRAFFQTGTGNVTGKTVEVSALRKDGTEFPIELSLSAMKIGGEWQSTGIVRDITERKTAREEIERQRDELHRSNGELSALYKVSMAISRTIDLHKLLYDILYTIMGLEVFNVEHMGCIFVVEGDRMVLVSQIGLQEEFISIHKDMRVGDCLCGMAAKTGEIVLSGKAHEDSRHTMECAGQCTGMTDHGHIIVPLKTAEKVVGVLCLYTPEGIEIDKGKLELLRSISAQIGIAVENARLYEETKALSLHDPLTGIANRRYMEIFLERGFNEARRYGRLFSIILLDIDYFKKYNDEYGHPAGDRLLAKIAEIISAGIRDVDLVARYGGEEFIILLPEVDYIKAPEIAERIRQSVAENAGITISLGVSSYIEEILTKEELMNKADAALYQAKQKGRNRVEVL